MGSLQPLEYVVRCVLPHQGSLLLPFSTRETERLLCRWACSLHAAASRCQTDFSCWNPSHQMFLDERISAHQWTPPGIFCWLEHTYSVLIKVIYNPRVSLGSHAAQVSLKLHMTLGFWSLLPPLFYWSDYKSMPVHRFALCGSSKPRGAYMLSKHPTSPTLGLLAPLAYLWTSESSNRQGLGFSHSLFKMGSAHKYSSGFVLNGTLSNFCLLRGES